jgi:hypothetical protein
VLGGFISTKSIFIKMIFLTILNTIAIAFLFYKKGSYYIEFYKDKTDGKILVAYEITLWKRISEYSANSVYTLIIPIRNKDKIVKQEEIKKLKTLLTDDKQKVIRLLSARFSWLKTWEEVRQFEKDYSVVDIKVVANLVANFVPKDKN